MLLGVTMTELISQAIEMHPTPTLLKQGAEAKIYVCTFLGKPTIIKERFKKSYRHPSLDSSLTVQRSKAEVRCMARCRANGKKVFCLMSLIYLNITRLKPSRTIQCIPSSFMYKILCLFKCMDNAKTVSFALVI